MRETKEVIEVARQRFANIGLSLERNTRGHGKQWELVKNNVVKARLSHLDETDAYLDGYRYGLVQSERGE